MVPIPRILFEFYVNLWGEKAVKVFFHPAPIGMF